MTDPTLERLRERAGQRAFSRRSDAYRWLRRRHAAMLALFEEFEPTWADVTAEMTAAGVTGGRGKPLTPDAVRRIWKTVCRDVAESAQRRAAEPRMPPGWRPEPVAILPAPDLANPAAARSAPAQATPAAPTPRAIPPIRPIPSQRPAEAASGALRSPEEIAAQLEAVREQMRADRKYLPGAHKQPARRP